jgi:hypothetical protein
MTRISSTGAVLRVLGLSANVDMAMWLAVRSLLRVDECYLGSPTDLAGTQKGTHRGSPCAPWRPNKQNPCTRGPNFS